MLEYNVIRENINKRQIESWNIFDYYGLENDFKQLKEESTSKEDFLSKLDWAIKYRFWSKCEYEVIVSEWPPARDESKKIEKKIDIYQQIKMNWHIFSEYVWENL